MRILILVLAATLLATTAQGANRKLPQKFVGDWCISKESTGETYRRGPSPDHGRRDTGGITVRVNGFDSHPQRCKVISALPNSGRYPARSNGPGRGGE